MTVEGSIKHDGRENMYLIDMHVYIHEWKCVYGTSCIGGVPQFYCCLNEVPTHIQFNKSYYTTTP